MSNHLNYPGKLIGLVYLEECVKYASESQLYLTSMGHTKGNWSLVELDHIALDTYLVGISTSCARPGIKCIGGVHWAKRILLGRYITLIYGNLRVMNKWQGWWNLCVEYWVAKNIGRCMDISLRSSWLNSNIRGQPMEQSINQWWV